MISTDTLFGGLKRAACVVAAGLLIGGAMADEAEAVTVDGTILASQVDYIFFGFDGGMFTVDVSSTEADTMIRLFEDDGSPVGALTGALIATDDDGGPGLNSRLSFGALAGGDYVLAVGAWFLAEGEARSGVASTPSTDAAYSAVFKADPEVRIDVAPVPLPAAGWMLLAGIGGLSVMARRRRSN